MRGLIVDEGRLNGLIVDEGRLNGLIINEQSRPLGSYAGVTMPPMWALLTLNGVTALAALLLWHGGWKKTGGVLGAMALSGAAWSLTSKASVGA